MNGFSHDKCRGTQLPTTVANLPILQREATILPWRNSKRIFVQANVGAVIGRIEPAIEPRLREEIKLRPELRVEKQCQTWIEESVDV